MDTGSADMDGLFDESLVQRVELSDDGRIDTNGGVNKRFEAFEPNAVMLVPYVSDSSGTTVTEQIIPVSAVAVVAGFLALFWRDSCH